MVTDLINYAMPFIRYAVKDIVDFISVYDGGKGAIREIAEKILLSQNKSVSLPDNW